MLRILVTRLSCNGGADSLQGSDTLDAQNASHVLMSAIQVEDRRSDLAHAEYWSRDRLSDGGEENCRRP